MQAYFFCIGGDEIEIEGFSEIISILTLAKKLFDAGRFHIVRQHFFDTLCYDSFFENAMGVISSVFSGFYNNYDENNETEFMLFQDDVLSEFYYYAGEYGRLHGFAHDINPYTKAAECEVRRWLNFSYSLDWRLLGYTKSKRTAKKSKLLVMTAACEFYEHDQLGFGLLSVHEWFKQKCDELRKLVEVEMLAA